LPTVILLGKRTAWKKTAWNTKRLECCSFGNSRAGVGQWDRQKVTNSMECRSLGNSRAGIGRWIGSRWRTA